MFFSLEFKCYTQKNIYICLKTITDCIFIPKLLRKNNNIPASESKTWKLKLLLEINLLCERNGCS